MDEEEDEGDEKAVHELKWMYICFRPYLGDWNIKVNLINTQIS